jgi:O-antigen ligase
MEKSQDAALPMATTGRPVRTVVVTPLNKVLLDWVAPVLFALLLFFTIIGHSADPGSTLARTVGNLLAVTGVLYFLLLALGRRITVATDVALLLIALAASVAVSVIGAGDVRTSLDRLQLYLVVALLATATHVAYRDRGHIPVEAWFAGVALVHLPFLLWVIMGIRDAGGPPFWTHGLKVPWFVNVRQFAELGFFAAVTGTGLGLLRPRLAVSSFLLAFVALFGLILTGSRGATLSWVLFVLLACCSRHERLRAAVHGLLVLSLAAGLVWYLDHSGLLPSPNLFSRLDNLRLGREEFNMGRFAVWSSAMPQILAHPLFGSGPEGWRISGCCVRQYSQAHNFVLQFLLEFGLVGVGIAVLLLVRAVKSLGGVAGTAQRVLAAPCNRVLACLVTAYLAYSLIDQTMYHLVPLLILAPLVGLLSAGLAQVRVGEGGSAGGQQVR